MVGKICTVCKQSSVANKNLSFFTYPSDKERRYEWLKAVDRLDLFEKLVDNKSRGNHRICEAHFQECFIRHISGTTKSRKSLTKDAFPSLEHVNLAFRHPKPPCQGNGIEKQSGRKTTKKRVRTSKNKTVDMEKIEFVDMNTKPNTEIQTTNITLTIEPISEIIPAENIKIERLDDDYEEKPASPQLVSAPELTGFTDMSQFCESVIKVNKETQTPQEIEDTSRKSRKRKLDPIETNDYFLQSCIKNLPKGMVQLVKWQMNSKENVDNYKFHMFALNLYFSGANAYNHLKDMMGLPSMNAVKKLLIPKSSKLSNGLINVLKVKVRNMSKRERICSVVIGTMQLKPNLYYNIKSDKVEGFHEIDGVQKIEPARHAVVFMVQGILEKWSQPIAYALVSKHENSPDISVWVEEIITLLIDVGLDVKAFVSDPKTELLYMLAAQRVTPAKPYFSINDKNIYYIYDTAPLQKTVKGFLKSCSFQEEGNSSKCCDNTEFTTRFNSLCTILNSTTSSTSPFKRAYSGSKQQSKFLNEMADTFNKLKVVRKSDGLEIKNIKFVDCMLISITSVMQLFNELKDGGAKKLLTSRLSQRNLNKLFSKVRSRSKKGCTCREFGQNFARCFVYNMLKKPIGDSRGNSEEETFNPQCLLSVGKTGPQSIKVGTMDYRLALPEKKRFDMVCRYLYLKCIEQHSCDAFKDYLSRSAESRQYVAPYRSSAPLDIRNCKLTPPQNFTDFITILEKRFRDYCKQDVKIISIGHQILKKIASFEFNAPCKCFPLDYLKKLFVRLRIFYAVRENNIEFKNDKSKLFRTFNL